MSNNRTSSLAQDRAALINAADNMYDTVVVYTRAVDDHHTEAENLLATIDGRFSRTSQTAPQTAPPVAAPSNPATAAAPSNPAIAAGQVIPPTAVQVVPPITVAPANPPVATHVGQLAVNQNAQPPAAVSVSHESAHAESPPSSQTEHPSTSSDTARTTNPRPPSGAHLNESLDGNEPLPLDTTSRDRDGDSDSGADSERGEEGTHE